MCLIKLMKNYLDIIYDNKKNYSSDYDGRFANFNVLKFQLKNKKILEIGCGKGKTINDFINKKNDCYATDISDYSFRFLNKRIKFFKNNIDEEKLPFVDNYFDVIYSKSVIEHLNNIENFFFECKRVLKKNGILIVYTPDWETQYINFYDDPTHVRPFTKITMENYFKFYNFQNYKVEKFYQLPLIWNYPFLKYFARLLSFFIPIRCKIRYLRFSKELMLCGYGIKE